jgi:hypothetical protein
VSGLELPPGEVVEVEVDVRLEGIRRDELAPESDDALCRYLVYLGAGYVEAERASTYDRLHRLFGAVGSRAAVLRFHYGEQARGFAEEKRAHAAHERMAGAYEGLAEKLEAEIALREQRVRKLEAALER